MFEVLINDDSVFSGDNAFAAWCAFRDMTDTMVPGDEVTLWCGEKLENIETRFHDSGRDFAEEAADMYEETMAETEACPVILAA